MKPLGGSVWIVLLLMLAMAKPVHASSPSAILTPIQSSVLSASSIQVKTLACLARGDIAGAIALYEAETGYSPPTWLVELQTAYGVANQVVGKCQQVASTVHTAFTRLGQTPQYIAFKAKGDEDFMIFELMSGKQASVARNGYHVAVRLGDMIYDAYTGPTGMKWADYLSRLHAAQGVTSEVATHP